MSLKYEPVSEPHKESLPLCQIDEGWAYLAIANIVHGRERERERARERERERKKEREKYEEMDGE